MPRLLEHMHQHWSQLPYHKISLLDGHPSYTDVNKLFNTDIHNYTDIHKLHKLNRHT
jgi:hypothetical protein